MEAVAEEAEPALLDVRNIGGIDETRVELSPGVTVLKGRNATNRTSLLKSLMAALGSENPPLKADADAGRAELALDGETYTRTVERRDGAVVVDGDPYLEDPTVAELFAFLLETNEARQTVARQDDLRELIMRPVDTQAIHDRIDELQVEKRRIDERLEELDRLRDRLPSLEERRTNLSAEIEEKREELEAAREAVEEAEADLEETREEKRELDAKLDELSDLRGELEDVEFDLDAERRSREELEDEREELEARLDELAETPTEDLETVDEQLADLRQRKRAVDEEINKLQGIIGFNEELLEGGDGRVDVLELLTDDSGGDVTDRLLADDAAVTCWTCGSEVDAAAIEETLEELRSLRQQRLDARSDLRGQLEELKADRERLREQQRERERVERRLESVVSELDAADRRIESLEEKRERLHEEIDELEAEIDELEGDDATEVLDLHKRVNRLEIELDRLEADRREVDDELAEVESELDEREELRERREEVDDELEECRTRIDRIETEAVDSFNDHMESILELLGYENIERVWIDRKEREVAEGRRTVQRPVFELHIVRRTPDGSTYEDTIEHLSESEREVTGLIFALAGYLVHEVYEELPFVLLDSLEAIDSNRIAKLVSYFEDYADYLVVALLPEDAAALDESYTYVTDI